MSQDTRVEAVVDITDWLRGLAKTRRTAFGEDGMVGCRYDEAVSEIEHLRLAAADRLAPDTAAAVEVGGWRTDFENAPHDGSDVLLQFWSHHDAPGGPLASNIVCNWDALENGGWLNSETLDFLESFPTRWMLIPDPVGTSFATAIRKAGPA